MHTPLDALIMMSIINKLKTNDNKKRHENKNLIRLKIPENCHQEMSHKLDDLSNTRIKTVRSPDD